MYGDYKYRYWFDETEESDNKNFLLTEGECNVVGVENDATLADCSTQPKVDTASQKNAEWSRDLAGHVDTIAIIGSEKAGQIDVGCVADNDMSEKYNSSETSRSNVDETSFTNHSMVCEGHQNVDWSELASARAALKSSNDACSTSADDDDSQSWTTDDEEPELRNLSIDSSTEMVESNTGDYENDTRESDACDGDDQPQQQTRERNNIIVNETGTFEEVCLSSSTYYFACSGQDNGRDESRTQRADDDDRDSTCSCCNSPPLVEKWTSDDDNDRRSRSSSDSRASRDSTADWYQQQVVKKHATIAGDFHHSRAPREHNTQAAPAAVSNCIPTVIEEAKWCTCPGADTSDDSNVVTDVQTRGAGDGQWNLECTQKKLYCIQQNGDDCLGQSSIDDTHSCCADCSGSYYDDDVSTFYVNYQHQTATEHFVSDVSDVSDSVPTLAGVQVCGPASFELLFLIDQLASTTCFVDDAGAFMTLLQNAGATSASCAPSADSTPRIVELHTDDEVEMITHATARDASARYDDDSRHDNDEVLNKATDKTTPTNATVYGTVKEHSTTTLPVVNCPDEQSDVDSEHCQQLRRDQRGDEQQKDEANDTETRMPSFAGLRRPRVPEIRSSVGGSQVNKDKKLTTTAKRLDYKSHATGGRQPGLHRRRLPPLDARTSTVSKYDCAGEVADGLNAVLHGGPGPNGDAGLGRQQRQQQQVAAVAQCDKYKLPDVFVDRKPPLPPAARRFEPSLGRGLRLPPVTNTQRIQREAPRTYPPPPPRRRSHPLAPRRPTTPPNRNVLASRAVWPSMASGRRVEDEWTRRAAVMRRGRLPPVHHTATVATWH